ncbi:MAG TPA: NAD-dependent epimerase/dehydratase family protein [Methylomirabilota bacterium]|nr:NAD-dependent epimerase/dehydratase family protein [Methylomirabilota bacterium]
MNDESMAVPALAGRSVLVTGGSGFLGRHLARRLAEGGARVEATWFRHPPAAELPAAIRWQQADCRDLDTVRRLFDATRPEIVYHLCGAPNAARDLTLVHALVASDLIPTLNVLVVAAERKVRRLITTASLEEPEPGEAPSSPYAAVKVCNAAHARMLHRLYQLPVVTLRPYMTYGPGQAENKVVPYLVRHLLAGQPPELGDGERGVDWIYIDDVIDGFIAAATASGVEGQTIDLGSGVLVPIRVVAEMLVELTGATVQPRFGARPARPFERVRVADVAAAATHLHWRPRVPLRAGLARTVAWWAGTRGAAPKILERSE